MGDLNEIEKFVVDNYKKFQVGVALDFIHINGYSPNVIAKKIRKVCNSVRMRIKKYNEQIIEYPNLYNSFYEDWCKTDREQLTIYTLKPRDQIPDIYEIIEKRTFLG